MKLQAVLITTAGRHLLFRDVWEEDSSTSFSPFHLKLFQASPDPVTRAKDPVSISRCKSQPVFPSFLQSQISPPRPLTHHPIVACITRISFTRCPLLGTQDQPHPTGHRILALWCLRPGQSVLVPLSSSPIVRFDAITGSLRTPITSSSLFQLHCASRSKVPGRD